MLEGDLTLQLERGRIFASVGNGPVAEYNTPNYQLDVKPLVAEMIEALDILMRATASKRDKDRNFSRMKERSKELFNAIFLISGSDGTMLTDLLESAFSNHSGKNNPPIIAIDGDWFSLPWELLTIPSSLSGKAEDCFLGEIAVVAGFTSALSAYSHQTIIPENKLQIASIRGVDLDHVDPEIKYLEGLDSAQFQPLKTLSGLSSSNRTSARTRNYQKFGALFSDQPPVDLLHGAFHSRRPSITEAFEIVVHNRAELKATECIRRGISNRMPNFAFFNTCHSLSDSEWGAIGIATHSIVRWSSRAVVASICEINDKAAAEFSQIFLSKFLPSGSSAGQNIGEALFSARQEYFDSSDYASLIGMCYRLIGHPNSRFESPIAKFERAA